MGIDIRASLAGGTSATSIPGGAVSGRSAAGAITQQPPPAEAVSDPQLQQLLQQSTDPTPAPVETPVPTPTASPATSPAQSKSLKPGQLDKSPTILAKYSAPNDPM